jgi:hypothetical protein
MMDSHMLLDLQNLNLLLFLIFYVCFSSCLFRYIGGKVSSLFSFLSFFLAPLIVLILFNYDILILACLDLFTFLLSKV